MHTLRLCCLNEGGEPLECLVHDRDPGLPVLHVVTDALGGVSAVKCLADDCRIAVRLELETSAVSLRRPDQQPSVLRGPRVTRRRLPDDPPVALEGDNPVEHQVITEFRERRSHLIAGTWLIWTARRIIDQRPGTGKFPRQDKS